MELVKHWAAQLDDYVIDLAWSPDGERLGVASAAGPISLYAVSTGALLHTAPGHADGTNCLAWQPSAKTQLLVSGGQEPRIKFWDAISGQHCATAELETGSGWCEHLAWKPALADSAETDEAAANGAAPRTGSPNKENCVLAAASGRQLYALRPDGSLAHRFAPAPKSLSALAWSPDGKTLAAAYYGGVQLWDGADFSLQKDLPYVGGIACLAWSPDGHWLVSGNHDPSVHLWRPAEDLELQMSGYSHKVNAIAFDARGRWLATSGGSDCCVWDCSGAGPEGRAPAMLPHDAKLCAVAFQNTHGLLAAASEEGTVKLWSVERALSSAGNTGGKPLRATVTMPAAATRLAWSPDDSLLAIGTTQGIVYTLKVSP
ncbi:hypothetical protein AXK12_05115 [Cephaloticoccus capnophilus]|uniref:Anaphase-promoting complex subunit 4-like WD40 domain-containing protein n=1 Tax=Cephaloticoccus capnophilus TaxID=1548208 RepID=A0A139SLR8_9BACT|nr:hypothetical protein [Cephaloticoccus capnophilus]KXU35503.1 hypothetical protein AXK12_05115 [Cephaloticoccus capnophilus]